MRNVRPYQPKNKIRIVTAASLFDGHDAAINIMRRIIQSTGVEVIHLGHDRSVAEVVNCAIQEDAQAIAVTSYQGGHVEYFKYMVDLLKDRGAQRIKVFGGGGGTILPEEADTLHEYGVTRVYSPDDGRSMGLQGMINDMLQQCDFPTGAELNGDMRHMLDQNPLSVARLISAAENNAETFAGEMDQVQERAAASKAPVLGITGTGGAGKSSLVDELVRRFLLDFPDKSVGIISVDPTRRKTGGALLGDRIRMNAIDDSRVYMRSLATRQANQAVSAHLKTSLDVLKAANYDLLILETSGIGQAGSEITEFSDLSIYVMTPEFGAPSQLEKIDMLDYADFVVINKFDKRGAEDALRDVRKQFKRNHQLFDADSKSLPIFGTMASQFNDPGTNRLYKALVGKLSKIPESGFSTEFKLVGEDADRIQVIPPSRSRYLSEISETIREYGAWADAQSEIADRLYGLHKTQNLLHESSRDEEAKALAPLRTRLESELAPENKTVLDSWDMTRARYSEPVFSYKVRDREIKVDTRTETLAHTMVPKVALPRYKAWGDILKWNLQEGLPGSFPFTSGIYPFKRQGEDPTRMFAGEGGPERTNRRFHYVSQDMPAKRLSTAFDSVTLYGRDPDHRPDIYGKVGNSGVSICCLDDAKKLYSGFDLCDPRTSVSMTINGPAPMLLAFFLNAAIDQQCELYIKEQGLEKEVQAKVDDLYKNQERPRYLGDLPPGNDGLGLMLLGVTGDQVLPADVYKTLKSKALSEVRGTVQADILKEDQAQNTCIFSTEFGLKLMGDVQEYFIEHNVRNFYSVSISGYHIAEAGANPITQLALTLANGFTYVEYYLARGMDINKFGPNLSFFFSNGVDAEYAVIGRVARRIWSKAMKLKYGANARSQMLKYHIQTSGRSLHAQEIDFNDIRTTLQALYAIYDNCNSLHTNAYDEAITTPTEESVRRAIAIQLIINNELGLAKNENPLQGSFIIEDLTDLVEEAVLMEFDRITERGGVLGAMETMYQRSKIQEESLYYEGLKHSGELPLIGVNTFLNSKGSPTLVPAEVIRATTEEKENQINTAKSQAERNTKMAETALGSTQEAALHSKNVFEQLMEAAKSATLGQITDALFDVGGRYRRNM